jgi:hypothetical protein
MRHLHDTFSFGEMLVLVVGIVAILLSVAY